jgi:putative ABC transport system permease protein
VNLNGDGDLKVTAVIDDVPKNSHIQFEYLVSMNTLKGDRAGILNSWLGFVGWSYVLLKEDANPQDVESKFPAIVKTHVGDHASYHSRRLMLFLQNIKDIYLKSHLRAEMGRNGSHTYVIVFSIIAFFILIIACINFMNLSTAKSSGRDQEVGLRKVFGATRQRLIGQFLIESILLTGLAFIVSLFLIWLCIPTFNMLTGKIFHLSDLHSGGLFVGILGLILFTGYISGSYPSLYLSSLQPAVVLKGKSGALFKRSSLRNVLVIIQFTISIFLILGTFIVMAQLYFMKNSKLGFDKEHILAVRLRSNNIRSKREILRQELSKHPDISEISFSSGTPGGNIGSVLTMVQEGKPASVRHTFDVFFTDENFLNTYGLTLKKGRNFSDKIESDKEGVFLINESAQKKLGWGEETIGKKIGFGYDSPMQPIVGVISDFHHRSLKEPIGPLAIQMKPYRPSHMSVKLDGHNISATLNHVKKTYHKFEKKREFKYFFIDDHLNNLYHSEEKLSRIISIFAVMAIFIACLGLFGLSSYITEQRTMEIGVRRVLGASVNSIFFLLSRYFLKWIVVANLIAWPLAYITLKSYWLTQFPYRISPDPWMFIFTGICSISIGLFTISFQSLKAAVSNPIDSLKYE